MKKHISFIAILLFTFGFINCNNRQNKTVSEQNAKDEQVQYKTSSEQNIKYEQIKYLINKSEFIKLPLIFDAKNENALKVNYLTDLTSNDTLLFKSRYDIVGFLPDTSNYYSFLYLRIGDMLYPTIVTMDKSWKKIDEKIICTMGCLISPLVDLISCYDSVWIYENFKIKSISEIVGTIEIEEDSISQISNIYDKRILNGHIDINGNINIDIESSL